MRRSHFLASVLMILSLHAVPTLADGLAPPSVPIAPDGTRIVSGGTGLLLQPGTIEFDVPQNATLQQVLVYWNGFHSQLTNGDDTIMVNDVSVTGQPIGGPDLFFSGNYSTTYRADITDLGLVQVGSNVFTVHGVDFDQIANGVSIMAIVSDDQPAALDVRDGQDLAFHEFIPPLDATVPQVFSFVPADHARSAELIITAGSVQGPISNDTPIRPNELWLTIGSELNRIPYFLSSSSGNEWDHIEVPLVIPPGVTSITVELVSISDGTIAKPASFLWALAALRWTLPVCGDGQLDTISGEVCDDGNSVDGDGCDRHCRPSPFCGDGSINQIGETCEPPGTAGCRADCTFCGDGVLQAASGESCDDGNTVAGDGCDAACITEAYCGDGQVNGAEQCDDGNAVDADFCSNACRINYCGDGQVNGVEQCDDGNAVDNDSCSNDCRANYCGDGAVNGAEQCDDGNSVDNDFCGNDCRVSYCGDGEVNGFEQCDDGNAVDNDSCSNDCRANYCGDGAVNGAEECDDGNSVDNDFCGNDCRVSYCGDGEVNGFEQCDDGNAVNNDSCSNDCRANYCGDGTVNGVEQCDDGNSVDNDFCNNECRVSYCGDGAVNGFEQCDDGNAVDNDSCSNDCRALYCGDGEINGVEECDDANVIDDDLCGNDCRDNYCGDGEVNGADQCDDGNAIDGDLCGNDCRDNYCGDGQVNGDEACDDGNVVDGDGCQTDCRLTPFCGDGQVDPGEQCDDANNADGDGCTQDCLNEEPCGLQITAHSNPLVVPDTTRVGCNTMGLPEQLRFRYTGGSCAGYHQQQDQAACEGDLDTNQAMTVLASGRLNKTAIATPYVVVPSIVAPGEAFTVYPYGQVFQDELNFELRAGGSSQTVILDTSCNQPLRNGDRFGGVTLVGYNKRDGNPAQVTFSYELANQGARIESVTVEDPVQGMIASGLSLDRGQSVSFSRTVSIWDSTTDPVVASGQLVGRPDVCTATDHADVFVEGRSATCPDVFGRRPQKLALRYTGDSCAASASDQGPIGGYWDCLGSPRYESSVRVVVSDRAQLNDPARRVWFDKEVSTLGGIVMIDAGAAGAHQLGPQTYVAISPSGSRQLALQTVRFDTSCGEVLQAGDQYGAVRVESVKLAN